jgi:tetratricopeptide (TPR) repeat protein
MEIPYATLEAIVDVSGAELEASLDRLQRAQFLYRTRVFPEPEYAFKHGLTREVAYDGLLLQRRRALHSQIVNAIEGLYAERLVDKVDRLAQHALAGEVWDKAVHYSRQAAAKAAQTAAYRAAIGALEQALVALHHLPSTPETKLEAIDVRFELRSSLLPVGELQAIHDHMRVAESLADELGDRERLARVYSYLCQYFAVMHEPDKASESGERAFVLAGQTENLSLQVSSAFMLGEALYSLGDFRRCAEVLQRNVDLLQGDLRFQRFGMTGLPAALSRGILTRGLAELGEFRLAAIASQEAIELAEEVNQQYSLGSVYSSDGFLHLKNGQFDRAVSSLTRAVEICRTWNISIHLPRAVAALGYVHVLLGQAGTGLSLLEEACLQAESMGRLYEQASFVSWLAQAYLASERVEDAIATARRAFELADGSKQQGKRAHTLRVLGEAFAAGTPMQVLQAETFYIQALELAVELGMRPLKAHCLLGLGRLHRRAERFDEARFYLNEAIALYTNLNMRFWIPKAEAELQLFTPSEVHTDLGAPPSPVELSGTR